MTNVLVNEYGGLVGRPDRGTFSPTRALLTVPAGRQYHVVVLASLPQIGAMRPYLRRALSPPLDLDPTTHLVVLGGLPVHFRATAGQLVTAPTAPEGLAPVALTRHALSHELWATVTDVRDQGQLRGLVMYLPPGRPTRFLSVHELYAQMGDTFRERLLEGLGDELEEVREQSARGLCQLANHLPVAPFLETIRDTGPLNLPACEVAGAVFVAHPDQVPAEAVVALYEGVRRDLTLPMALSRGMLRKRLWHPTT